MPPRGAKELVVVFGASSGIGAALAERLVPTYAVRACARRRPADPAPGVEWRECDIRRPEQVAGALDPSGVRPVAVINCAGIGVYAPLDPAYAAHWREIFETNVLGALNVMAATLERAPDCAHLIGVGSMAARRPSPTPGNDVYAASKAAFVRAHEDFRLRLRRVGSPMRVTVVTPGFVAGTGFGDGFFRSNPEAAEDLFGTTEALRPEDVAGAIAWCLEQPDHVEIAELAIRPRQQAI